ncbi:uroporphyrin-III methyltransferase [Salegentibacter salinarum]|uniref:uroporphyrinogen-III C-methyltransferase n=1 Tax=Salegentibacter salinarum TaxID=447422 RepID=A0A2N0TY49_9FLAO|nr:uroporphyrinogen-III C-methyltransferase [Salegentibacter salinarum]PKD19651.1 uroporphyrin-III methyltransferase [Salegentibacter salinarum]SKB91058.1 uroporphyrin-III C-methyltransferase [Salegentibacter salinarum]
MQTLIQNPKCTIVGAGPGDPDLLTLKAVKTLSIAAVVLYDALVNPQILEHASNAEKIFVGKRKGCHAYAQDQINELIVKFAREKGPVVRLKGGDPFVFGRGSEEKKYACAHGVKVEIIPGISSAISVPASAGIPVTKRHTAESFWVITGTTSGHKLSKDVALAAKTSATVVILMGMSKLAEIVALYKNEAKGELPIAIIQNGTWEDQKLIAGNIHNIENLVKKYKIGTPAIIIIGEVVKECEAYNNGVNNSEVDEFVLQNLNYLNLHQTA